MSTVADLTVPKSGYNWIDALLDVGPSWNNLIPAPTGATLYYTFSVASGNELNTTGQVGFTSVQQQYAREAIGYLSSVTGIKFAETTDGAAAQIHFCNTDITLGSNITGLCSWHSTPYDQNDPSAPLNYYQVNAYIYLDNNEFYAQNSNPAPGTAGYQTLLHELGHAMGLKHPFEDGVTLPAQQDNTANTLMSYNTAGGPYMSYNQYDIAALNWLYGRDGLGGLGATSSSNGRYITGTNGNDNLVGTAGDDTLEGAGGNDTIDGGPGTDTVVFHGARSDYTILQLDNGSLLVTQNTNSDPTRISDGTDTLTNVEILNFLGDGSSYQRAQVADTTPPAAPAISVTKNANGYALGDTPVVTGSAEVGSTVKIYSGTDVVGSTVVDSTGLFSITTTSFKDGKDYAIFATATDAAGNTSAHSQTVTFNIDAHAPTIPTATLTLLPGHNDVSYGGTAEAGTTIQLFDINSKLEMGRTTATADGYWHIDPTIMPNGSYSVSVVSIDAADNATSSASRLDFTINNPANMTGDSKANTFTSTADNNGIDGGAGIDTVVYNGPRANFTVTHQVYGYSVVDNTGALGRDTLVNVERLQFSDGKDIALDIDGNAGMVFRLYQAAFDRTPDPGGYGYWLNAMDHGYTLNQISAMVLQNKEAVDLYMTDPSDNFFVTQLYHHVLHRDPDAGGLAFWLSNIHSASRADVLAMFSESPENQAQVIGSIQNGIEYTPWHTS